ncbi:MAG: hypothetical protein LC789_17260 [Actinobacteria bacterium]|nr:hypothetical protein [Actinomycetota bacterium]
MKAGSGHLIQVAALLAVLLAAAITVLLWQQHHRPRCEPVRVGSNIGVACPPGLVP